MVYVMRRPRTIINLSNKFEYLTYRRDKKKEKKECEENKTLMADRRHVHIDEQNFSGQMLRYLSRDIPRRMFFESHAFYYTATY